MTTARLRGVLVCGGLTAVLFVCSVAQGSTVTITLDVCPSTPTTGIWSPGDLVEIVIRASSDGGPGQGLSGAEFLSEVQGIFVDTGFVKIHDVLLDDVTQIDTEADAGFYDNQLGYSKSADTWVYDYFTDFVRGPENPNDDVLMSDGSFKAISVAWDGYGYDLGRASPVSFLHVVLEIQPGFAIGASTDVTFTGQVCVYNTAQEDIASRIFDGDLGGECNTGSFTMTVLPAPGDFNFDFDVNADDIDLLLAEVRAGANDPAYDLTDDALVNQDDADRMIREILDTEYGDATLDGEVNGADLSLMACNWLEAEDQGWATGDLTGDGAVDGADLSLMAANWLFDRDAGGEGSASGSGSEIPEPATAALILFGGTALIGWRRRHPRAR